MSSSSSASLLVTKFVLELFTGWNFKVVIAYVGCILLTQVSGGIYYGTLFGKLFMKLAHPNVKTDEDKKRLQQEFNPSLAYGSAFLGSAVAYWFLKTFLQVLQVTSSSSDGAFVGVGIVFIDTVFGIMHSFFEDRPLQLYLLHKGYHVWCFGITGAIFGTVL